MNSPRNSESNPLAPQKLLAGIIITVVGGVILAYILQDGRFAPEGAKAPPFITPTGEFVEPTQIRTNTSPPIGTPTMAIATSISSAPVIDDVVLRIENSRDGKILHQDIHFHDGDGDAYIVTYELVSSTRAGIRIEHDEITAAGTDQMTGAIVTGTWHCKTGSYVVVLKATILDRVGNKSNPRNIPFDCK